MCGRYYVDDDIAREIEKLIRQVDEKMRKAENIPLRSRLAHRICIHYNSDYVFYPPDNTENIDKKPFKAPYPSYFALSTTTKKVNRLLQAIPKN